MATSCTLKEYELLDGTTTQKVFIHVTPAIIGIGVLGNILTVCVFIATDLKRQSVSILTIALAIVDSLVLLIPVSLLWLETLLKRELTDASPFWCRTHGKCHRTWPKGDDALPSGFFDLTFTCCSSWLMVCIAFERFCAVWLPHQSKVLFTHRKIFILVLSILLVSTMLSTWFIFVVKMVTKTRITNIVHASPSSSIFRGSLRFARRSFSPLHHISSLSLSLHVAETSRKVSSSANRGQARQKTPQQCNTPSAA